VVGGAKKDPSVILADLSGPDLPFKKEDHCCPVRK